MCRYCHGLGPAEGICGACGAPSLSFSGACGLIPLTPNALSTPPNNQGVYLDKQKLKLDKSWPKDNHFLFDFLM